VAGRDGKIRIKIDSTVPEDNVYWDRGRPARREHRQMRDVVEEFN